MFQHVSIRSRRFLASFYAMFCTRLLRCYVLKMFGSPDRCWRLVLIRFMQVTPMLHKMELRQWRPDSASPDTLRKSLRQVPESAHSTYKLQYACIHPTWTAATATATICPRENKAACMDLPPDRKPAYVPPLLHLCRPPYRSREHDVLRSKRDVTLPNSSSKMGMGAFVRATPPNTASSWPTTPWHAHSKL